MKIAFLGLGIMGSRMAANLIKAGHTLTVWNRSANKAKDLVAAGAKLAKTPAEAAAGNEIVITMLSAPRAVDETALGPNGFLPALPAGAIWMDCSTVNPSFSKGMAAECAARGVRFLDAPTAGTKAPAQNGQLMFLVGGSADDLAVVRPLLEEVMGNKVIHVGAAGMGASLKMIFNLMLAQSMLAFAEGLVLGEALGIPRAQLFDIFTGSRVIAPSATAKREKIEADQYEADFPLQWMQKDLMLASLTAFENDLTLPATDAAKSIYMKAVDAGFAEQDFSAIYKFLHESKDSR